jgi:carbohydrate binding protein with CBM4/9 domain/glycosyl hydrolase family 2
MRYSILVFLFTLLFSQSAKAATKINVPNPSFEIKRANGEVASYCGAQLAETQNPHSGKHCLKQSYRTGYNWNAVQMAAPYIKCKPNTWYRLSTWNRNTVPAGNVSLGIRQCYSVKADTKSVGYVWKQVQNNINIWTNYSLEFKTSSKTNGLSIYFKVGRDVAAGEVFWDDVYLEQIEEKITPMTVLPMPTAFFEHNKTQTAVYNVVQKKVIWNENKTADIKLKLNINKSYADAKLKLELKYSDKSCWEKNLKIDKIGLHEFPLNFDKLNVGNYILEINLFQKQKLIQTIKKQIIKLPDADYLSEKLADIKDVKIGSNQDILINGVPFIPIYFSHFYPVGSKIKKVKSQFGMNLVPLWTDVNNWKKIGPDKTADLYIQRYKQQLDVCRKAGVYGVVVLSRKGIFINNKEFNIKVLRKIVENLKDHPALAMWSLIDEPELRKFPPEKLSPIYSLIKNIAPQRPVWVNLYKRETFKNYNKCSDFASYDYYPFPAVSVSLIYEQNCEINKAFNYKKPLISYLQVYNRESIPMPSYKQLRAEAFVDIICGMKCFFYYSWKDPYPTQSLVTNLELQSYLKALCYQIKTLRNFLTAPTPRQPKFVLPHNVKYLYKVTDKWKYIIMVNMNDSEKKINISFKPPKISGKIIEVMFENDRKINLDSNGFVLDTMSPLAVHVYRYKNQ